MSIYRQIHTQMWRQDEWFVSLKPDAKLLFIYLFSNEAASISGLYRMPLKTMANETDIPIETIDKCLQDFEHAGKVYYRNGTIFVKNLCKRNASSSSKVLTRIESDLAEMPDGELKEIAYETLKPFLDTVSIGYQYGMDTVSIGPARAEQGTGTGTGNREQEQETESVKVASSKRDSNLKVAAQSAAPRPILPKKTKPVSQPPEAQADKDLQPSRVLYAITMKKLGRKPETDSERGKWNRGIKELVAAGVSGEEYERLLDRAEREWGPGCDRNPMAIAPNLSSLRAPPKAERDKAEEAARVKAEAEYRRADKAMLDELARKYGGELCNR